MKNRLKLTAAMTIFGTIGIVRRFIHYPSGVVALARGVIGALFLLALRLLRGGQTRTKLAPKTLALLIFSGVLLGANWILLFEAYRCTSVSVATICYYMAPVFVILLSPLLFKERLTLKKGLCAAAAVLGMVLVSGVAETGFGNIRGVLLGLAAAVMYAAIVLVNKSVRGVSPESRTLWQLAVSAAALLPYVLLCEDVSALVFDARSLCLLALAGVLHTGIAYALYFGSVSALPTQTAALLSYLDPVISVILSVLILREKLTLLSLCGVVLVLSATVFSELSQNKNEAARPA